VNLDDERDIGPADPFVDTDEKLVRVLEYIAALLAVLARTGVVIAVGVWVLVALVIVEGTT
jgi:hypothetical protein